MTSDSSTPRAATRGLYATCHDPQPFHHSNGRIPDHLQYFSADLFARLFVHGLRAPIATRRRHFVGLQNYRDLLVGPAHLEQFHDHREIRLVSVAGQMLVGFGLALLLNRAIHVQGPGHHAAAAADDDVGSGRRAVLAAALQPVLGTHQLCLRARRFRLAVGSRRGALRGRDHRHLDVVAVRDAAVAGRAVGGAEAPLRGGGDRPRQRLVHLHAGSRCRWSRRCC